MHPRPRHALAAILLTAASAACVTINIYFPAAAAEKAADLIIDEVWRLQGEGGVQPPAAGEGVRP